MSDLYLVSTLLMGLFLVATAVAIGRGGQRATPSGDAGGRTGYAEWSDRGSEYDSTLLALANDPVVWTVAFVVTALLLMAGTVLFFLEVPWLSGMEGLVQTGVIATLGALVVGYVFFGTYFAVRDRSGASAVGVGVAAVTLGLLLLAGVVVALVTA